MTARADRGTTPATAATARAGADGWRSAAPELLVAAGFVLVTSAAVYLYAGLGAAVLALVAWAILLLVLLRSLVPATEMTLVEQQVASSGGRTSFTGFWRKRGAMKDATASMSAYDLELRPTLQHLLAARLAERHGISLYQDPAAARRLLLPDGRADELWFWLDPQRPAQTRQDTSGIPPRTLAAIIDRLERL